MKQVQFQLNSPNNNNLIYRYFHSIKYLKFKQIYYRIWYKLYKPRINFNIKISLRLSKKFLKSFIKREPSLVNKNTFIFLNKSYSLSKIGWRKKKHISKLWRYNQHYFDDLNAKNSSKRLEWHNNLLKNWIKKNKIGSEPGWDSYPTSLRIVNWIKWHISGNFLTKNLLHSLYIQAIWLSKRLEWHILGNHLFSNAKALVFSGLFFSGKKADELLSKGIKIIDHQLKEQVLKDGGNFELSPMYHSIFLEDLLDLINIANLYNNKISNSQIKRWKKIVKKMLKWLNVMTHPDNEISFFNDAAIGIAPNLKHLIDYANRLKISHKALKLKKLVYLPYSGYIRFASRKTFLILDVSRIGPDYLTGHSHADTLSFELSLFKQRFLVNGGTSGYQINSTRNYERSTKAHNTVEINGENSSEVWSSFRVAKRAYPKNIKLKKLGNFTSISCSHDGYTRLFGNPIHKRTLDIFENSLSIKDKVEGPFQKAYAYFHFHPLIKILKKTNKKWSALLPNGNKVIIRVKLGNSKLISSYYAPEFGKKLKTKCLKVKLDKKEGALVQVLWGDKNE